MFVMKVEVDQNASWCTFVIHLPSLVLTTFEYFLKKWEQEVSRAWLEAFAAVLLRLYIYTNQHDATSNKV
jgi:hypothetical protein